MDSLQNDTRRQTKVRKALLSMFQSRTDPVSVPQILKFLEQEQQLSPNKTTIYREIEYLLDHDLIHEVRLGDRKARYETSTQEHHHHLICIKCQKIEDVALRVDVMSEERRIEKEKKFKVLRHSLEFFGICEQCLR